MSSNILSRALLWQLVWKYQLLMALEGLSVCWLPIPVN